MIRIGEFSKLAKTTVKTLRFYDEINLFKPSFVDDNGYRYYTIEQLNVLNKIFALRNLDVPLDEIRAIIMGRDPVAVFAARLKELENELRKTEESVSLIKKYMAKAEKGEFMENYQAKKVSIPESKVYYRHGVIGKMSNLSEFVLQAGQECVANNPTLKCTGYCFVTYEAPEYQESNIELEYVEGVEEFGKESENIKFKTIPAINAIVITHKGPYPRLGEAYAFGVNWVMQNGYTISDKIREVYIHGCWDTENEEDYVTEIQIPIE